MKKNMAAKVLATIAGVAVAAGVGIGALPTASAQPGSRICGNFWYADVPAPTATAPDRMLHRVIARYMEVGKGDFLSCNQVKVKTDNNPVGTDYADWAGANWQGRFAVDQMTCEAFTSQILLGSVRRPDNSPEPDVCNTLNRANSIAEVNEQSAVQSRMQYVFCANGKVWNKDQQLCLTV